MSERPRAFDTGYHMMWSLLDGVTPAQIKEEIPRIEQQIKDASSQINGLEEVKRSKYSKLRVLKELIEREEYAQLKANFKITEEHKKLIKAINWESDNPYEYLNIDEVVRILEWKRPNYEPSDEQVEAALKLLKQIPIAVNKFFTGDK